MKILNIRFKNLNSLVGEWAIDLTDPAYTSDGIFAITGPTGSGKTTILDAICLALYGQTPRLGRVTKSSNEIMSQQTGECFSEVTFETQSGRFRCHWSQHRARKKSSGDLQSPKHEIAEADSGKVLQASLRGVTELVEAATGMNFERFTRSMLLAQGGFDAFLQADPSDRSPILEQLTGTEIYSQISKSVHERRSVEAKKLDILQAELDGMQLLSEEDEQQLQASLEQKIPEEADLAKKVVQQREAIAWLEGIEGLEKELNLLDGKRQDLLANQTEFKPKLKKLERAKQALELAAEYTRLDLLRRGQEADRQGLSDCVKNLPEKEAEAQQADAALKQANDDLLQSKNEQKKGLLVIRKVRELDFKLEEKEASIKGILKRIAEHDKTLDAMRTKNSEDCRELDLKNKALDAVLKTIDESKADESLVEHLAGIRTRFNALSELDAKHRCKVDELKVAEIQKNEALQSSDEQSVKLVAAKKELVDLQRKLKQQQDELNKILAGREISDWRDSLFRLRERKEGLNRISESLKSVADLREMLSDLNTQSEALNEQKGLLFTQVQTQTDKKDMLEKEMHELESQLSRIHKILDFEAHRHQLQEGESCPLCGAEEHPFAEGNIPVPDETTQALNRVRADFKQATESLSGIKVKQAENGKDLAQVLKQKKEVAEKIATEELRVCENVASLAMDGFDTEGEKTRVLEALAKTLPSLEAENDHHLENSLKAVQTAENIEKKIATMRVAMEEARDATEHLEREAQTASHQKESTGLAVVRINKDVAELAETVQNSLAELLPELSKYDVEPLTLDALDSVLRALTIRRERWLSQQDKKIKIEKTLSYLMPQTKQQTEQITKLEGGLRKQQGDRDDLMGERDDVMRQRQTLFGDKKTDDEESRLTSRIEQCDKQRDDSRQRFNLATQKFEKLKNSVETFEKSIQSRAEKLKTEEARFITRLGLFDFSDEADYQAACLPEDERNRLMQQAQQLEKKQTALDAMHQEKVTLLKMEQQKEVTDQPRELLVQALETLASNLKELQQTLGGIQQKLKDNEDLRCKQQARTKAIDAQKRESLRWDTLHELIGSADGKKYRNFAQGLTFEMMVGHANRQLQKMTDRYLLIRDDRQPLELNVMDSYHAGEIRSTKNLSGGESFIVSLSLALGLSQMASKNVRVDSLFLDEGFGTLDEDALDTALETLSGLQEDGKLIGVISHVSTLKERISTQIQVIPQTGGRSVICGPGCDKLDMKVEA